MLHIVWEFVVKKGAVEEFERIYGPDGAWARIFAGYPGFVGTTLLRDEETPRRYLTIDVWETDGHRRRMLTQEKARYADLDEALADLTESEDEIGNFESVGQDAGLQSTRVRRARTRGRPSRRTRA